MCGLSPECCFMCACNALRRLYRLRHVLHCVHKLIIHNYSHQVTYLKIGPTPRRRMLGDGHRR